MFMLLNGKTAFLAYDYKDNTTIIIRIKYYDVHVNFLRSRISTLLILITVWVMYGPVTSL